MDKEIVDKIMKDRNEIKDKYLRHYLPKFIKNYDNLSKKEIAIATKKANIISCTCTEIGANCLENWWLEKDGKQITPKLLITTKFSDKEIKTEGYCGYKK